MLKVTVTRQNEGFLAILNDNDAHAGVGNTVEESLGAALSTVLSLADESGPIAGNGTKLPGHTQILCLEVM